MRGGAAIVFPGQYAVGYGFGNTLGFTIGGNFVSPDNGITPAFLLRSGLPPIPVPTEADLTPGFGAVPVGRPPTNQAAFFEPHNRRSGYLETFNFNVQRQVTANLLVELGYLATLGHKLPAPESLTQNQVRPERMGPGNAQIRRPFPQFSDVLVINPAVGNSNYHGMNLRVEKRHSHGLQFQANYTWSRFLDDVNSLGELSGGPAYADVYNRRADRGLSGNHLSHRLVLGALYEFPIGNGRAWNLSRPLWKHLLGGWSTGFNASVHSGPPYGVIEQTNQTNSFSPAQRPNVSGDPRIRGHRSRGEQIEQWFDTAAFRQPPQFTFGNAGSTAGYAPGAIALDLSILKEFRPVEQHRLQFRTEMLNCPNHPNLLLQAQNLQRGNPAFGRINASGPGRIIQLGLRYSF
jgi:hypothetical protein